MKTRDNIISIIKDRINSEYKKHKNIDWQEIASRKIYSEFISILFKNMELDDFDSKFEKPFRVGKKQNRTILDNNGLEVTIFPIGLENLAEIYCEVLNNE